MIRLTFVGDIACDRPLLKASKKRAYDFSELLHVDNIFSSSDVVIGNLETCFGGGPRYGYKPFHYSVPDSFCTAIHNAGINIVSTANNHCLDEGIKGLKRTLEVLDNENIYHTGTFSDDETRWLSYYINGKKIAFFSVTYSVNRIYEASSCYNLSKYINIIGFQKKKFSQNLFLRYIQTNIRPEIGKIRRKLSGKKIISAYKDVLTDQSINSEWLERIDKGLLRAKKESDIVILLLHIGGQFNEEPGTFSEYMVKHFSDIGVDVIVGHHPHTVQKISKIGDTVVAYSLGGFCLSPSSDYVIPSCLPDYSVLFHVDIDEKTMHFETSTEIIRCIEAKNHGLHIVKAATDSAQTKTILKRLNY